MVTLSSPSTTKIKPSTVLCASGLAEPPPGATSIRYCAKVVAPPATGRLRIQTRVSSQSGSTLVTMSRMTPRGITV
jgi:hypothetical protein